MDNERKILLIFDNLEIKEEVVSYTLELAKRMNSDILLLLLLSIDFKINRDSDYDSKKILERELAGRNLLKPYLKMMEDKEVGARGVVKIGDPASQLLKLMAEEQRFLTIVWGGDKRVIGSRRLKLGEHWLAPILSKLECPFVTPTFKHD